MGNYTKSEMIKRFFAICSVYGFKTVTIDDMAKNMGMSKKTLYRFFNNKEDIVENVLLYYLGELKSTIHTIVKNSEDTLPKLLNLYTDIFKQFNNVNPVFFSSLKYFNPTIYNHIIKFEQDYYLPELQKIFTTGIKEGVFRKDTDFEYILIAQNNLFRVFFEGIQLPYGLKNPDNKHFFNLIINEIRGMSTLKGYKMLDNCLNEIKPDELPKQNLSFYNAPA